MREPETALDLARAMVSIGTAAGRRMAAVVSDMSQPLGRAVGNALEVAEALDTLEGHGPPEFTAFAVELASTIVSLASADAEAPARARVEQALRSGAAREALRHMVSYQGGDTSAFDDRHYLPAAGLQRVLQFEQAGYVSRLDALGVARASIALGAGRERKGDPIDLAVGVVVHARLGQQVAPGEPLATLHANDAARLVEAERTLRTAVEVSPAPVEPSALILYRL
jgi:pyrimidine-nucleoside phosphorylase